MFFIYNKNTGNILQSSNHPLSDQSPDWDHIEIPEVNNIQLDYYIIDVVTKTLVEKNNAEQLKQQRATNLIRRQRNAKLAQTDWTQLPDVSLSQQQKDQWASYRQQLRDLPDSLPDPLPPGYRPTWPQKP